MYSLILSKKAEKDLQQLPEKQKLKVIQKLHQLVSNPFIGKKLQGELQNKYSIKVVPYRIIYIIYKKEIQVVIVAIGHRKDVYKNN